eukprot:4453167-Pleurochrysis_carterae.AAC.2
MHARAHACASCGGAHTWHRRPIQAPPALLATPETSSATRSNARTLCVTAGDAHARETAPRCAALSARAPATRRYETQGSWMTKHAWRRTVTLGGDESLETRRHNAASSAML